MVWAAALILQVAFDPSIAFDRENVRSMPMIARACDANLSSDDPAREIIRFQRSHRLSDDEFRELSRICGVVAADRMIRAKKD